MSHDAPPDPSPAGSVAPAGSAAPAETVRLASGVVVTIRAEAPADHDAIRALVGAAFASARFEAGGEEFLVDRIRASPEYVPEMALVAVLAEAPGPAEASGPGAAPEIVGHVMVSGALLRHEDGERPVAMLSPLSVAPAHQGEGIGGALIRAVCAIAARRGEPIVVLEGSPQYYRRHGFEPAANLCIGLPIPGWASPDAAQLIRLASFDPADTSLHGTVVYPVAFDELD